MLHHIGVIFLVMLMKGGPTHVREIFIGYPVVHLPRSKYWILERGEAVTLS